MQFMSLVLVENSFGHYKSEFLLFREVKLMQKTLKQLQAESNKRDAKLYTTMFARLSNENSSVAKVCFTISNYSSLRTKRGERRISF